MANIVYLEPSIITDTQTIPSRTVPRVIGPLSEKIVTATGTQVAIVQSDNYKWSANALQGLVVLLEGMILYKDKVAKDLLFAGIIFLTTFIVPPNGWLPTSVGPNEKLTETVVATLLSSIIVTNMYDGTYYKNAIKGFIYQTSSMGLVNGIYLTYFNNWA